MLHILPEPQAEDSLEQQHQDLRLDRTSAYTSWTPSVLAGQTPCLLPALDNVLTRDVSEGLPAMFFGYNISTDIFFAAQWARKDSSTRLLPLLALYTNRYSCHYTWVS